MYRPAARIGDDDNTMGAPRMVEVLVGVHSLWRWAVLLVAIIALVRGLIGWLGSRPWTALDGTLARVTGGVVTLQVVLGVIIWLVQRRWDDGLFLGLVHPLVMIVALGVIQAGTARIKRANGDAAKHRTLALSLLLGLFLITAAIPAYSWSRAWVG